ncbi:MAG: pyridoxal-phosphate dependent enzyme [Sediminibacterium sp.]|jgi:threonine dehydratase|nr:pyridoxal-phosphate dependent enzyme [Sediminibacterium sp.]
MSITKEAIEKAAERIDSYIHHTPVMTNQSINEMFGINFYFKCENFQKIGAFKIRGGMNASLSLDANQLKNGVATHSSGNHAQALAYAAKMLGIKAYIVMPKSSPQVKVDAVRGYGAEVIICEANQVARETALKEVVEKTGAEFIHPYDDDRVITGQATCVKELLEEVPQLDTVITPVGGGGLLSGTCLGAHYYKPSMKVYAGEPEGAADAILSIQSGKVEKAPFINTIADGLMTTLSERTLAIIKEHVTAILLVSDDEIKAALRLVYERMKIIVEPSCVVPLAAAIRNKELFQGKNVGIILSGGNVDLTKFGTWFPPQ